MAAADNNPASEKTITDTTNTVVEANKKAASGTTDAVKASVKATEKAGDAVTKAVEEVGKAIVKPSKADSDLKDISKSLAKAVGKLAFDKTLGKLPDSIKSIGGTIIGAVTSPAATLAKMGEGVLGKLDSWAGADIGADILNGIAPGGEKGTVEGGEEGEEKSQLAEDSNGLLGQLVEAFWAVQDIQANMLNIMVNDSADAAEAAREAARAGMAGGKDKGAPDAKVEEAKAGGFFSRMGAAVMNPMKALGSGMSKIGKGIQGILTGIARGLMAFANPLVLVGVTFLSLSLPILAAGLAAAFAVFDMIAGKGAAMEILTGIITSLGTAIGTILREVLHGLGLMIGAAGPAILDFFKGVGIVIEALTPIIGFLVPIIESLMAALTAILTNEAFNKTLQEIVTALKEIVLAVIDLAAQMLPILETLFTSIEGIVKTLGDTIVGVVEALMSPFNKLGDVLIAVVENIGSIIKITGDVIVAIIKAMSEAVGKLIDDIVTGIERLAAIDGSNLLVVAAALLALGGALAVFGAGAMIAGAIMPTKEELESMANSVSKFGDIDATNFAAVGTGIAAIGAGLQSFAGGGFLASLSEGFGKLIGASDPVEKFQKFSKLGPGLIEASEGIKTLALAMKTFEKTVKEFDLSKVDAVAEGLAKIRDAQDPGALSKIGGIVGSIFGGGDDDEKKGGGGQGVPALITETNLLLKQGMLTGPSGLFGSPGIGTSAFLMTKQNKEQIDTGQKLNELQEESNSLGGSGATTVVVNNQDNSQSVQSSQPLVLPTPAIAPGNGGANLPTG
jgi:phage-related protein